MNASKILPLALGLVFATGCNLLHIKGPGGAGGGGTSASADPAMVKLFATLDYKAFPTGRERGRDVLAKAGIDVTQIGHFGTPDAEWLPGWNNRGSHDELADAFVQGAINKTWSAQCIADWADYRAKKTALEAALRPSLTAAKANGNFYDRASGLRDLFGKVIVEEKARGIALPAEHPMHETGILYEVAVVAFQTHRESHRDFAAWGLFSTHEKELGYLYDRGRTPSSDEKLERDIFCKLAETTGTHRTPKIPFVLGMQDEQAGVVKWPDWDQGESVKAMNAIVASKNPKSHDELAVAKWKVPHVSHDVNGKLEFDGAAPKLALVGPLTVTSVKSTATKTTVTLSHTTTSARGYGCVPTSEIESVDSNGYVRYKLNCKTGTDQDTVEAELVFAELPSGFAFAKDDEVEAFVDIESDKSQKLKDTAPLVVRKRSIVGAGRHLARVKRGGAFVVKFF